MQILRNVLLLSALLGAAGGMPAQDNAATPETETPTPDPPKCIPLPHVQEHWVVAKSMPFSGKRVMTCEVAGPDGTIVKGKKTQLEWRDSEGRFRLEQPAPLDPDMIHVIVVDPVQHIDWTFTIGKNVDKTAIMSRYNPSADSFEYPTTYQTLPGGSTNRRMMATPHIREDPGFRYDELKSTYVNGVWCEGSRDSRWVRPDAGNNKSNHNELEVTETWISEDLFTEVRWKMDGAGPGKFRNDLIDIDRSEPDPALFGPPAGYRVLDTTPKRPLPESSPFIVIPASPK